MEKIESAIREAVESLLRQGFPAQAVALLRENGAGKNRDPAVALLLAQALEQAHDTPAAMDTLARAIQWKPDCGEAYLALGRLLLRCGPGPKALAAIQTAVRLLPHSAEVRAALAQALASVGRKSEALTTLMQAVEIEPRNAALRIQLGLARMEAGDALGAECAFAHAAALEPANANAWRLAGKMEFSLGKKEQAIQAMHRALALNPRNEIVVHDLARALEEADRRDEAILLYQSEARLAPSRAEPHYRMGECLRALGRPEEAVAAFDAALARDPGHILAHGGRALALLALGRFKEGWPEYEWRWKAPCFPSRKISPPPAPEWSGQPLDGKRILVCAEQGFGDTLMLARYIPLLAQSGAHVLFQVPPELTELLRTLPGARHVTSEPCPGPVDFLISTFSLPGLMNTPPHTIPAQVPYITPDRARTAHWQERLASFPHPRVGLCCAGNPLYWRDASRSCPLALLKPLFQIPNIRWINLSKQLPPEDRGLLSHLPQLLDLSSHLSDFATTAAIIANLDLVLSVDTAVAHLAGALAKPVWLMLPHVAEWRWQQHRSDSPWYPTMRLFRQSSPSHWPGVIARIAAELATLPRNDLAT